MLKAVQKQGKNTQKALCNEVFSKGTEHHVVFESFVQATQEMLDLMSLRNQKMFAKRIRDCVHGTKLLGDLKNSQTAEWDVL